MIGTSVAQYRIEEKLGGGGMGVVYRAHDTRLHRDVALKFLPPGLSHDEDAKARFMQEARAASGLDHPNICTIHEIGEADDGRLYIAMSYYDGQTLKYLLDEGAMPSRRAASIASQIAEGLAKAHAAGIIHRDIKPANIMVTADDRVKILDFGVAKLEEGVDLTQHGSTVGTTAYMSPEQARGEEVDGRTDIWSLGVILYQLLSGRRPFEGGYDQAILYAVLNQDPAPLTEGPDELAAIAMRMLAKDPADRFPDAEAVLSALDPFASGVQRTAAASPPPTVRLPRKWTIPVVAVLLAGLLWVVFEGRGPSDSGVDIDPNRIVVLPFLIQGTAEMEPLGDGMVTILGNMLDGAGPITTVDPASVLEYLQRTGDEIIGPGLGRELAEEFDAGRFVVGSIVRAGTENRMSAGLYTADGTRQTESEAIYTSDEGFIAAVDGLAAGLVVGGLSSAAEELSSLAVGTTESFEALKHYLEGDRLLRAGQFDAAMAEADQALAIDTTFALAWHLKSEVTGWMMSPFEALPLTRKANQYARGLTGRVARFLEAELAFQEGRMRDAERMLRAILRDYPESVEAIGSLAEVFEHYDLRESAKREELRLLERVTELAPGNQQYAMHHSDVLAYTGHLDGDFRGLDSLAASYAGLPIPEPGDSLDWSVALERMSPDSRRYMLIYARLRGSPEDSLASFDQTVVFGFDANRFANVSLYRHAIDTRLADPEFSPNFRHAQILWGAGRRTEASGMTDRIGGALWSVELVSIPTEPIEPDSVQAIYDAVADIPPEEISEVHGPFYIEYFQGLMAWRMADRDRLRGHIANMQSLRPDTVTNGNVASFARELNALDVWMSGDLPAAEAAMEKAFVDDVYFLRLGTSGRRINPYWYLASIREERGDLRGAIDMYANMHALWAVAGWERVAPLYEQLGETDRALRYYQLIVETWADADPELQTRVEAARQRINAILDARTREPS